MRTKSVVRVLRGNKNYKMEDVEWVFGLLTENTKPDYFSKSLSDNIDILCYSVEKGFWKMLHTQICLLFEESLVTFIDSHTQIYMPPMFFTNTVLTFYEIDVSQNVSREMLH